MEDEVKQSSKDIVKEGFLQEEATKKDIDTGIEIDEGAKNLTAAEIAFKIKQLNSLVADGELRYVQEFLMDAKISVNTQDEEGISPLMVAAANGRVRLTEELIANQADLNLQDALGETALIKAIINGYNRTAQLLIEAGADLNIQTNKGLTALIRAVHKGDMDMISGLVNHGVDLDIQDCYGFTALMHSVQVGFKDVVLYLIEAGADLGKKDVTNKTAKDWANVYSQVECFHLLDALQKENKPMNQFTKDFKNQETEEGALETTNELNELKKIMGAKIYIPEQERTREE